MNHFKLIAFACCMLVLPTLMNAQTYTWNGGTSSDWNTITNWTPNGIPGVGNTVNITNAAAPNMPALPGDITVANLTLTNSSLNLASHQLIATATVNISGSTVASGSITALNFSTLSSSNFTGNITLTKTGGANNTWAGGNTFQNLTLINNDDSYIRMGNTTADTYNGSTHFVTTNGYIDVAYTANATFNGNVTIDASGIRGVRFGQNTGLSTIASGYALLTNGYTSTQLIIKNLTQNGTAANGTFTPINFTPTSCIFGGDFTCSATTINMVGCEFRATNNFTGNNLSGVRQSAFSSVSGTTTFNKNAGSANTWYGGNTFINTTINNNSADRTISLASTAADLFYGTTYFNTTLANRINVAYSQGTTFNGDVYVNNTGTSGIYFGANNGVTAIASGYALLTSGFAQGVLSLNNVTQSGTVANGNFSPTTFTVVNSTFNGDFTVSSAGTASITGSTFSRTNNFSANNISTLTTSNFSTVAGTTTLTKLGGTTDTWAGDNTFNNSTIINSSTGILIRIGTTGTTTFNGTTRFEASGTNYIQIAYTNDVDFNGNVYLDCTSTNGISFGTSTGNTTIAAGYALLTNGFTDGTLRLTSVTQDGSTANATFHPAALMVTNSTIRGNFTAVVTGTATISNSVFQRTNSFTAAAFATMSGNNFSATSGTTTFTKTGNTNEVWAGANTFYNTTITNNSAAQYIRLAGTNGDSYLGTTYFAVSNDATMQLAYNLASTFAGNVYLNCTGTGGMTIGAGTGTMEIASGYAIKTNGYNGAPLDINELTQLGTAANDSFTTTTMTITGSTFGGNLTFAAATAVLQNSVFYRTNRFFAEAFTPVTGCTFSTGAYATLFTKRGASNDTWAGSNTFGNVTLHNRSDGRMRLSNTTPDTYNGTLIMVQDSTGAIEVAYNGVNEFYGNISAIGSTSTVAMAAGTGTVTISGNTAQSVLGSVNGITMRRLTMSTSGTLTLQTPVTILTSATFTSGKVVSDAANLLIINDNVTVTGANNNSYVNGPVRKVGNDAFSFPVGSSTFYAPIAIYAPGSITDHFTAQYFHLNPHNYGYDTTSLESTMEMVSTREYWMLDRTNGSSAVRVTMSWGAHSGSILDMNALRVARWDGSQWMDHSFSNFTGNNSAGSVTSAAAITDFSPFTFGSSTGGGALPVEMTEFTAEIVTEGVKLNWITAIEINNDYYVVERSMDGANYTAIGSVKGNGNTSEEQHYEFVDVAPKPGLIYYRLKQVDFDGTAENSKIVTVFIKAILDTDITWTAFPNPADKHLQITGGEEGRLVGVELVDQTGRSLSLQPLVFGEKNSIDISGLKPGMYVIRIITPEQVTSQRFVKL